MPDTVVDEFGFALYLAQTGRTHEHATPLKGFGGAGTLEVVSNHRGDTFRAIYTVHLAHRVYVLHCFQKKSRRGIATPRHDIELIRARYRMAKHHAETCSDE